MGLQEVSIKRITKPHELKLAYDIRLQVFGEEQGIPAELEIDEGDEHAIHVLAYEGQMAIGTGRIVIQKDGVGNLSRIAVCKGYRGRGLGQMIVKELEKLATGEKLSSLYLYPHYYLEEFYSHLGYHTIDGTSEAGKHRLIKMEKHLTLK